MRFVSRMTLVSLLLTASVCSGQNRRPPTRYQDYGACPFECCTYRRWSVDANTVLYKQRSTSSGVAFRVRKGDHVSGLTGVVVTLKPGEAIVKKATTVGTGKRKIRVKIGDILYLLHYEGESFFKIWFRGVIYEDEMPTAPDLITKVPIEEREEYIHVISQPDYVWWVKVKNRGGQVGWSKETENFGDKDSCG
jgi:hypothetical protein